MSRTEVVVVGAGLAGCEAAWQLARRGIHVRLVEMRPGRMTPAHKTGGPAELVCSNSLGADAETSPGGILKSELRSLGSLIISCADECRVPAGRALAVDRESFSALVAERIAAQSLIRMERTECLALTEKPCIVATGPLTSPLLVDKISDITGKEFLYFFDAAAPIVSLPSIDPNASFWSSRYGAGDDYLNCPMDQAEYDVFVSELVNARRHPLHDFEEKHFFEGCLPVEEIASRGPESLRFGPFSPKGLNFPDGSRPYAVLQLRLENRERTMLNLVGCQTNLTWPEQERVFRLIPALRGAEFLKLGVMHRNIFLCAPQILSGGLRLKTDPDIWFAGQITGVEGYVESCASGLAAGIGLAREREGLDEIVWPEETAIGGLLRHLQQADPENFQPMNFNLGLLPPLPKRIRERIERCKAMAERSRQTLAQLLPAIGIDAQS
jgi:methylenetetrahydrofolate--tRNA-(uracil-5-)-methyltransferase